MDVSSAIAAFAQTVQANQAALQTDLDSIKTEIANLNQQIQALQNSPGQLGPSDQATLDAIAAASAALKASADALVVPPVPPVPPPTATPSGSSSTPPATGA